MRPTLYEPPGRETDFAKEWGLALVIWLNLVLWAVAFLLACDLL